MAQTTSFAIANDSGIAVRLRINEVIAALLSASSGSTAPTSTVAGMLWFDTGVSPAVLRQRNSTNTDWEALLGAEGNLAGLASPATARSNLGLGSGATAALASQAQAEAGSDASVLMTPLRTRQALAHGETQITGGYTMAAADDGSWSGGSYTPSPAGGNIRRIVNAGAFILAAPTYPGDYSLILQISNTTGAGAITLSGFTVTGGGLFTTTPTDRFLLYITVANGLSEAFVRALQ
jgi:hypothetical protein